MNNRFNDDIMELISLASQETESNRFDHSDEYKKLYNRVDDRSNLIDYLESKIKCPLEIFVRFILGSYVYYDNDGELLKCVHRLEDFDKETLRTVITCEYYDPKAYNPHRTYKPNETNACKTFVINLRDYKKTWWLNKEKDE